MAVILPLSHADGLVGDMDDVACQIKFMTMLIFWFL